MELLEKNMSRHNIGMSSYACLDSEAIRLKEESKLDIRSPFFRDIDRIIYSYSYVRYMDKTQVFPRAKNDHITKRMVHVQMVSKIARTIGRALGLNEDLIEAASLGHDIGHAPFGHFGEAVLNKISLKHNEGYFNHNIESVRLLMDIEHKGKGLNLTVQVLDAIMCHNGEFVLGCYEPKKKTVSDFLEEYQKSYYEKDIIKTLRPMTLEGCVVRISDIIAYLGRDIDDACSLHVFDKKDIPDNIKKVLGVRNKDIINTIINDVIKMSIGKPYIKMSKEVYEAIKSLKEFNYQYIYSKSLKKNEQDYIEDAFNVVYEHYLCDLKQKNLESDIFKIYLNYKSEQYILNNTEERIVLDYVAGMTDNFLINSYKMIKNMSIEHNKKEVVLDEV